mmetsp:Transcript_11641/g.25363  ORF Transcript_11641/g.25363 Transcript_11641/m.25363 type:complete len:81 (+) Transcript_11641:974-1216(+)
MGPTHSRSRLRIRGDSPQVRGTGFDGHLSGLVVDGADDGAESSRSGRSAVRVHDGAVCAISSGFVDDEAPAKDADEESGG